jgi:ribosome-binding protein aMBF1 (putative translation factor)
MMPEQTTPTTDRDYTTVTVSREFRDKIRVAKAKEGVSYEKYLAQHLPIESDQ